MGCGMGEINGVMRKLKDGKTMKVDLF